MQYLRLFLSAGPIAFRFTAETHHLEPVAYAGFRKGGGDGGAENLRTTNTRMKISPPRISRVFRSKSGENQKKRSSLKFSPIFGPKLGAGQKQRSSPTVCVLKPST